jgi:hypothetical protein
LNGMIKIRSSARWLSVVVLFMVLFLNGSSITKLIQLLMLFKNFSSSPFIYR